jgi:hypothetical protein
MGFIDISMAVKRGSFAVKILGRYFSTIGTESDRLIFLPIPKMPRLPVSLLTSA